MTRARSGAARSRRRYRALLEKVPPPGTAQDPAEIVADRDAPRIRLARAVLASTRPEDRDLVMLTAVEGFTVAQAAEAIGISQSAAKMRLSRLRSRMTAATQAAAVEGGVS